MDFVEQVFRIAPDGGNGLTELAIVLVCVFVPLGFYWLRNAKRRSTHTQISEARS
jgi:hypothetical protein